MTPTRTSLAKFEECQLVFGEAGHSHAAPSTQRSTSGGPSTALPRSSKLPLRKEFSEPDQDRLLHETFDTMARFFEGSLDELPARDAGIMCRFQRVDCPRLTAHIHRNGRRVSECAVALGDKGFRSGSIADANDVSSRGESFNEMVSGETDDQCMDLKSIGMAMATDGRQQLSQEGSAEFFWRLLVEALQRGGRGNLASSCAAWASNQWSG